TAKPRCGRKLRSARSRPSRARVTTTGISPAQEARYDPGSATCAEWPTYCQVREKIRSDSRRRNAGSEYQLQGSVRSMVEGTVVSGQMATTRTRKLPLFEQFMAYRRFSCALALRRNGE